MRKEDNKILKYIHGEKPKKVTFIIYADLESSLGKMNTCYKQKSSTTKINKYTDMIIHCLLIVCLIQQKIGLIVIEVKTVCKRSVRI